MAGFALLLIFGAYLTDGESSIGVGYVWYFSLPAAVLAAVVLGLRTHQNYIDKKGAAAQTGFLLLVASLALIIAPIITAIGFWVLGK
jgi:hypothetical protein